MPFCCCIITIALASCASKLDGVQGDEKAQKKFQEISEAYDTLKESGKRSMYDRVGPEGMDNMGGAQGFGGTQGFGGFGVRMNLTRLQPRNTKCVIRHFKSPTALCTPAAHAITAVIQSCTLQIAA